MSKSFDPQHDAEFDRYAHRYDELHTASIKASGENTDYFAVYKQKFVERILGPSYSQPVLDFGCGIGNLTRFLTQSFREVYGYDPSSESLSIAKQRAPEAQFVSDESLLQSKYFGAIVLANVLHHVPPQERIHLLKKATSLLSPGGKLIVFEHNPLNPLTCRAVADCPFDADAVLLYPWELRTLLRTVGLQSVRRDYIVFFPKALSTLRFLEPYFKHLPLGAQMCVWGTYA